MVDSLQEFNLKPNSEAWPVLRPYTVAYYLNNITCHILRVGVRIDLLKHSDMFHFKEMEHLKILLQISRDIFRTISSLYKLATMSIPCIKEYCLLTSKRNASYTVLGVLKTAYHIGMGQQSDEMHFPRGDRTGGV